MMSRWKNHAGRAFWLAPLFAVLVLTACGQKGDLYLPDKPADTPAMAENGAR